MNPLEQAEREIILSTQWYIISLVIMCLLIGVLFFGMWLGKRKTLNENFIQGAQAYRANLIQKCKSGRDLPIETFGDLEGFVCKKK